MKRNTSKQRVRTRPNNRWTDSRTAELLNAILVKINDDPEQFEKPTRRAFYQEVARSSQSLYAIEWSLIANKIRNLRVSYAEAKSLRDAAADIDQWNERDIEEQVAKKCPFYNQLEIIYGSQRSHTSDRDETSLGYEGNFEGAEDDDDDEENEENDNVIEKQERTDEEQLAKSFKNCSDTIILSLLKDDSAELHHNVKQEQEAMDDEEDAEEEAANTVNFEKILMPNEFKVLHQRAATLPWPEEQTKTLLESALHVIECDAAVLQEFTPQTFYQKLLARCSDLRRIDWTAARSKMAQLRASYVAAGALLKQQTGAQRLNDEALNVEIHRVCPFFDLLHRIFGRDKPHEMIESVTRTLIKTDVNEDAAEQQQQSSESEDAYPFDDEEEVCAPTKSPKMRRLRLKPNHSWTKKATEKLLSNILKETNEDPEAFENPTAQTFYRRVFPQVYWQLCRNKMRNLRKTFKLAQEFHDRNSDKDNWGEDWVREKVLKICPYFGLMSQIFNSHAGTFPVETLDYEDEEYEEGGVDNGNEEEEEVEANFLARLAANKIKKTPSDKPKMLVEKKEEDMEDDEQPEPSFISEAPLAAPRDSPSLWAFRKEQLKLEREKVVSDLEIRKLELQHEFDIRKLEVERDERLAMAKLKFEMEERVKKYELELKLRGAGNSGYLNL